MRSAILPALAVLGMPLAPAGAAEWSVSATALRSGTKSGGEPATSQDLRVGYAAGERVRFYAALGVTRVDGAARTVRGNWGAAEIPGQGAGRGSGQPGSARTGAGVTGEMDVEGSGLGDLVFGAVIPLAGGGARLFALEGEIEVKAPTADRDEGLGTGEWDARGGLAAEYRFWSGSAFASAGWRRIGDPDGLDLNDAGDLAVGYESEPTWHDLAWSAWLEGITEIVPGTGARYAAGIGLRSTGNRPWRIAFTRGFDESDAGYELIVGFGVGRRGAGAAARGYP